MLSFYIILQYILPPNFVNIPFLKSGYFLIHIDIIMAYEFDLVNSVLVYKSTERKNSYSFKNIMKIHGIQHFRCKKSCNLS